MQPGDVVFFVADQSAVVNDSLGQLRNHLGQKLGLIDAAALSSLPAGAHLINIGRGEIVDQPALVDALASGRLAGAYLDVFDPEPLAPESPLWDMPNVIVSSHDAASAAGNDRRVFELFGENLGRWQAGQDLRNEAQPTASRP